MADTRGLHQDALHKKSIAAEIQNHLDAVNAVLILANGSIPRISVSMDYALTTLSALFPKSLADNIAFLLSNVPTPASLNFPIPEVLKHVPKFLIDNPIALQKNYFKQKGHMDKKTLKKIKQSVELTEENALEMLVELLDWLDGLEPQPTTKNENHIFLREVSGHRVEDHQYSRSYEPSRGEDGGNQEPNGGPQKENRGELSPS